VGGPSDTTAATVDTIRFTVNGEAVTVDPTEAQRPLVEVLRETLGLTGTKRGCAIGYCGTCTVLVDGEAVPSCLLMAGLLHGVEVRTVEGLQQAGELDAVQQGFVECAGLQCGFCTPGHLVAARGLLDAHPDPSDEQIRASVDGLYCRCTGYVKIVDSIRAAARIQAEAAAAR
jgi:aerobic-type carbon monoxide dehydrogenase small subunit (CoxS/CutS family)